jgi:hypothetical protein
MQPIALLAALAIRRSLQRCGDLFERLEEHRARVWTHADAITQARGRTDGE